MIHTAQTLPTNGMQVVNQVVEYYQTIGYKCDIELLRSKCCKTETVTVRDMIVFLLRYEVNLRSSLIAWYFNKLSDGLVSRATIRMHNRLQTDENVRRDYQTLEKMIGKSKTMNRSKLFILTIHPEATANQWAGKTKGIKNEFWHIRNGAEIIGTGRSQNAAWKDAENKAKAAK